jgi:hypothetical protein
MDTHDYATVRAFAGRHDLGNTAAPAMAIGRLAADVIRAT